MPSISIFQNRLKVETKFESFNWAHLRCFDEYNFQKDIFEIRHKGPHKVSKKFYSNIFKKIFKSTISVKIINKGIPYHLKFGEKRNLNSVTISAIDKTCDENFESTSSIYLRNGEIWESECDKQILVLNSRKATNIPMVITVSGKLIALR